jgi:hypothetical protein
VPLFRVRLNMVAVLGWTLTEMPIIVSPSTGRNGAAAPDEVAEELGLSRLQRNSRGERLVQEGWLYSCVSSPFRRTAPSEEVVTKQATWPNCKAGGRNGNHENYDKPCVPVRGLYDGQLRMSCVFCGKWLDLESAEPGSEGTS